MSSHSLPAAPPEPTTLEDFVALVDNGLCYPMCLFGAEDVCRCRCKGRWHAEARGREVGLALELPSAACTPAVLEFLKAVLKDHPGNVLLLIDFISSQGRIPLLVEDIRVEPMTLLPALSQLGFVAHIVRGPYLRNLVAERA